MEINTTGQASLFTFLPNTKDIKQKSAYALGLGSCMIADALKIFAVAFAFTAFSNTVKAAAYINFGGCRAANEAKECGPNTLTGEYNLIVTMLCAFGAIYAEKISDAAYAYAKNLSAKKTVLILPLKNKSENTSGLNNF